MFGRDLLLVRSDMFLVGSVSCQFGSAMFPFGADEFVCGGDLPPPGNKLFLFGNDTGNMFYKIPPSQTTLKEKTFPQQI